MPNKTDVLPFLSNSSSGGPERFVLATVMFGAPEDAYLQNFKVGPLPITNASIVMPYTYADTRAGDGKIPVINPDAGDYGDFNLERMKEAEDVTKRLWNLVSLMLRNKLRFIQLTKQRRSMTAFRCRWPLRPRSESQTAGLSCGRASMHQSLESMIQSRCFH